MTTFIMLGKYSLESVHGISSKRTKDAQRLIQKCGGEVKSMYAVLGKYDLVFIVDFPGTVEAMKTSMALSKSTGISFSTFAAMPVEEFDKLAGD